jgi:hypothetical protein
VFVFVHGAGVLEISFYYFVPLFCLMPDSKACFDDDAPASSMGKTPGS